MRVKEKVKKGGKERGGDEGDDKTWKKIKKWGWEKGGEMLKKA